MWSKRITSGNEKYPDARDVLAFLLSGLLEKKGESSWAHFEIISAGGWFHNLLSGGQPWLEVGYGKDFLELNSGIPKSRRSDMPALPGKWHEEQNGTWSVPREDADELIQWMDKCFTAVSGSVDYKLCGWIEGL